MKTLRLSYGGLAAHESMDWLLKIIVDYYKVKGLENLPPRMANAIDTLLELS